VDRGKNQIATKLLEKKKWFKFVICYVSNNGLFSNSFNLNYDNVLYNN